MSESVRWFLLDARSPAAVEQRQRARLAEMVGFARARSPYYRALFRDLPERVEDPTRLPVTGKKELMQRFDDWVTDREVTSRKVRTFVENPDLVGERFLSKYTVATTSGTTGVPGIFLMDDRSLAVTATLMFRVLRAWLSVGDVIRIVLGHGRLAMVIATGGHYASNVAAARLRKRRGNAVQVLPVHMPLPELVEGLNRFRPAILAPYASMGALLAGEQRAGRLRINPVLVVLSAEGLPAAEYTRIAKAFEAKVRYSYAATECPFISYSCQHEWLHVNSDWLVLEPVDATYGPTPPGEESHTVLVTNLANRVQPIIRYDLGDRVLQRPDPCPCGNRLPAIRVHGRTAEVLTFATERGEKVSIVPLALSGLTDQARGIEQFQIVQTTPTSLRVRLRLGPGVDSDRVWQAVHAQIVRLLTAHKLDHVTLIRGEELPQQSAGGKYREIIPLSGDGRGQGCG